MVKPDCYECKYRGSVPGSAHSYCKHPAFTDIMEDPMAQLLGTFASVRRVPPIRGNSKDITVKGNPCGIKNGWFNHPFNFDPRWLEECNGFEAKAKEME